MKKAALLLAFASVVTIGIQSCKKEEAPKPPVTETYNVSLKVNEAYTFTLPESKPDDAYEITNQSTHYSISEVGKNAEGKSIYQYTPAPGYTGTDQVVLSNLKEGQRPPHEKCGPKPLIPHKHPHGNCGGDHEDHYIITINFTIEKSNSIIR